MCGIAGVFSSDAPLQITEDELNCAAERLHHRGPDHASILREPQFALIHTRLAIVDLDPRSNQPFWSPCKRYVLVFNGEIYNYKSLRAELQADHPELVFTTAGDTEVLLQLMCYYGVAALPKLNGCFAFAFIDTQTKQLTLVRDRMGVNPMWIEHLPNHHIQFASERKALPSQTLHALNKSALHDFLRLTYIPGPESAKIGVEKLKPGHYLTFPGQAEQICWYNLKSTFAKPQETPSIEHLRTALREAVVDRFEADVAVGTFLSGGLDSSIVSALAAQHQPNLSTFSVGFKAFGYLDESEYALQVAQHIKSRHTAFEMTPDDLIEHAERFLAHLDEPFADASSIAVSFLAEKTRAHVKVALSGDGADELFGGYRKHRGHALALHPFGRFASLLHPLVRAKQKKENVSREQAASDRKRQFLRFAEAAQLNAAERYQYWCQFTPDTRIEDALGIQLSPPQLRRFLHDELQDVLLYDQLQVLPYDMLTKVDLMSMRYNLEVRVPFLDPRVIAVANALPSSAKYTHRKGKIILHSAFGNLLPATILARRKQGFEIPLEWLLLDGMRHRVEALRTSDFGLLHIDSAQLNRSIDRFFLGDKRLSTLIWCLVVLDAWMNQKD